MRAYLYIFCLECDQIMKLPQFYNFKRDSLILYKFILVIIYFLCKHGGLFIMQNLDKKKGVQELIMEHDDGS